MKVIVNMNGMLMNHDGSAKLFKTDGKQVYACGGQRCYYVRGETFEGYVPVTKCIIATK